MSKTATIPGLLIGAAIGFIAVMFILSGLQVSLGSVEVGNEYTATTTKTMTARFGVLKASPASLGSVTVASTSVQALTLWNATSTSDIASTSLIAFPASVANGTYTFDADISLFNRGLIVETPSGFDGSYVITWR